MKKKIGLLMVLVLAFALPFAVFAGDYFYESFDDYAAGDVLVSDPGTNGWKGWGDSDAVAGIVTDTYAYNGANSIVIGYNGVDTDAVHEFNHTSGQWVMTAWQYVPSTLVGNTYFIMLNQYTDNCAPCNWSVEVQFDALNGIVIDDASAVTTTLITDEWVEIRVEIDLDTDSHSFYYDNNMLYQGVWNGYLTGAGTGADAIAALDLYAGGSTEAYYDNISLVPAGTVGPALEVSKTPDNQSITAGGNADFTITVTNTGDITFTDVVAVDPLVAACDNSMTDLAPGASDSYTCTDTGVAADYTNTVWVTGTFAFGPAVTSSDTADVTVNQPTSVSLSSFGADDAVGSSVLFVALIALVVMAGGAVVVFNRQRHTN